MISTDAIDAAGDRFLEWANPEIGSDGYTRGWLLTSLSGALGACAFYSVVVLLGFVRLASWVPPTAEEREKQKKKTPSQRFREQPIRYLMVLYNVVQIVLCAFMAISAVVQFKKNGYSIICNPFSKDAPVMAFVTHVFYLSKVLDFFDTIFIVANNNMAQFSFLHVFHHFSIFLFYWLNINVGYDGDVYFTVVLNSFIHFVMYTYYLVSLLSKAPWWGKYVTNLQMLQFICMNVQAVYIIRNGCPYPRRVTLMYLFYILFLLFLFAKFYIAKYTGKGGKKGKKGKKE